MAAAHVASGQFGNGQSATTSTAAVVIPAGASIGDYAVVSTNSSNDTATVTTPSGWTLLSGKDVNGTTQSAYLFGKTLVSGDPGSTVNFVQSAASRFIATIDVATGVTATGILSASSILAATATPTLPTIASVPAGSFILGILNHRLGNTSAPTVTVPSGYTTGSTAATNFSTVPNETSVNGWKIAGSAGTYGGESGSSSPSSLPITYLVAIPPASSNFSDSASFSGSGTLAVTGTPKPASAASLSGSGTVAVTGTPKPAGTATFSSTGTLNAQPGAAPQFSGSGTLAATPTSVDITKSVALSGSGSFLAIAPGQVFFGGSGALAATGSPAITGASVGLGSEGQLAASGFGSLWHFTGPVILDYRPLELLRPGVGLIGWIPYGKSVWKDALGQWHEKYAPDIADLDGAQVVYAGGRIYPLTNAQRLDLVAGGYGNYITLEAIQ